MDVLYETWQLPTPADGTWPYYSLSADDERWRNGREAGAWIAGVVQASTEKCAQVALPENWSDGAVCAMVRHGCIVQSYSRNDDEKTRMYLVRRLHFD